MKKVILLFCISLLGTLVKAQPSKNLTLLGSHQFPGQRLSGCWHYNKSNGKEYAIVGAEQGILVIDITDPANMIVFPQLPGATSLWHEVKVLGDFGYAVSEGSDPNGINNGVQIIDLRYLPDSIPTRFYKGDGAINNQLTTAHSITVNSHYVYVNGHNITSLGRGVLILDVTDPIHPVYSGAITQNYCHDSYVRNNRIYTSDINVGQFSIYDITNPASPVNLASQSTPGGFNHNTWLSDNSQFIFTTDERTNKPLAAFDITDLSNITLIDTFYNGYFKTSEVHNVRVFNDYLLNPSYGSQLTIADASHPDNIVEVANYTTGSSLCWDADPFLNSGNIIATDMSSDQFFVFGPTYVRACLLEGTVTDSITGIPLNNVIVQIQTPNISLLTNPVGVYKTGYADSGQFVVRYTLSTYNDEYRTVNFQNGIVVTQDVKLKPFGTGIPLISESGISIFPNPAKNDITIQSFETIHSWSITDVTGKTIRKSETELKEKSVKIDVSAFPPAVYSVRIVGSNGNSSSGFVKN